MAPAPETVLRRRLFSGSMSNVMMSRYRSLFTSAISIPMKKVTDASADLLFHL